MSENALWYTCATLCYCVHTSGYESGKIKKRTIKVFQTLSPTASRSFSSLGCHAELYARSLTTLHTPVSSTFRSRNLAAGG